MIQKIVIRIYRPAVQLNTDHVTERQKSKLINITDRKVKSAHASLLLHLFKKICESIFLVQHFV